MFQMLRGTMVVFAGLLTIVILRRALHLHHWMGIILILAGAALVGASRCACPLFCPLARYLPLQTEGQPGSMLSCTGTLCAQGCILSLGVHVVKGMRLWSCSMAETS